MRIGTESLQNVRKPSFWFGSSSYNFLRSASSRVMLQIEEDEDMNLKN